MPARILIIDPSVNRRILIRSKLEHTFHQVLTSDSVKNALTLLRLHRPSLIILGLDPLKAPKTEIRQLRADPFGLNVPIIAIGNPAVTHLTSGLLRLGADEVLPEDCSPKTLSVHVHRFLKRHEELQKFSDITATPAIWGASEHSSPFTLQFTASKISVVGETSKNSTNLISDLTKEEVRLENAEIVIIAGSFSQANTSLKSLIVHGTQSDARTIVLCDDMDERQRNFLLELGVEDAVSSSIELSELSIRVEKIACFGRSVCTAKRRFSKLYRDSITDPLTGLNNRRACIETLESRLKTTACAIIYCDIDHFKNINDSYGHAAGDRILKEMSALFINHLPTDTHISRIGGEEFLFILPTTSFESVMRIAEDLCTAVAKHDFEFGQNVENVTISLGVIHHSNRERTASVEDVISRADQAMYRAKRAGRNRVASLTQAA